MKTLIMLVMLATLTLGRGVSVDAEENLLVGISSENFGLRTSSAFYIGEYNVESGVIPLLKMLKNGDTEEERILAANSLMKLNSDIGKYAVKQRSKFDESPRVRRMCGIFYNAIGEM